MEMTPVESRNLRHLEPLGRRDHRRIGHAQREARVLAHQLSDPDQVACRDIRLAQVARRKCLDQVDLRLRPRYLPSR